MKNILSKLSVVLLIVIFVLALPTLLKAGAVFVLGGLLVGAALLVVRFLVLALGRFRSPLMLLGAAVLVLVLVCTGGLGAAMCVAVLWVGVVMPALSRKPHRRRL